MAPIYHELAEHTPYLNLTKSLYTTTTGIQPDLTSKISPIEHGSTNHVNTNTVHTSTHNTTLALILAFVVLVGISFWKWCCVRNDRRSKVHKGENLEEDAGKPGESEESHSIAVEETQERKDGLDITNVRSEDVRNEDVQIQTPNSPPSQSQQECMDGVDEANITDRK
ncbi:hypothetical protein OCU04_009949 [Sclerotinia nivalis]|uniref:Uncharacterized protein n=1 Tax=Sclerotinia nivalis TaxID=352851 RepID=A0A9X0ADJ0_9HELO|nr:hypothetical protein OCU04_009949 [Sclerotinia nivalis]